MKGVLAFFHYCLFAAVPVFLVLLFDGQLWPSIVPNIDINFPFGIGIAAVLCVLMASLFVAILRLLFDPAYREACLGGLAGVNARDEREGQIIGTAARSTLLVSLVATIGLAVSGLFLIERDNAGGTTSVLIAQNRAHLVNEVGHSGNADVFELMPLSKTGVLVFMLALQLAAFRYFSHRAARGAK